MAASDYYYRFQLVLPAELTDPRIALVHEWLDHPGGAENVLLEMIKTFPGADVWSLWNRGPARDLIQRQVQTTWLARTPLAGHKMASLPFMPLVWRTLPRRDYQVVITGSYAFAHTAKFRSIRPVYLQYIYTPARYWWLPELDGRIKSRAAAVPRSILRGVDRSLCRDHRWMAAISETTRERIRRFWGLDARVINPPVDTDFFIPGESESQSPFPEYILGFGRWVPYKRLDLVITVGEKLGIPVVIAGCGPMADQLRQAASAARVPVRIEQRPTRERVRDLYRGASALIFPTFEDFGIVPVEALACGIPVVGLAAGGLLETVEDGVSGRLADRAEVEELAAAFDGLPTVDPVDQAERAQRFSAARFRDQLRSWVAEAVEAELR